MEKFNLIGKNIENSVVRFLKFISNSPIALALVNILMKTNIKLIIQDIFLQVAIFNQRKNRKST